MGADGKTVRGMAEYIDREALLKMIGTMPSSPITDREERLIRAFISTVKNFPAADVRPVVRGEWQFHMFTENSWGYECRVCHTTWDTPSRAQRSARLCVR